MGRHSKEKERKPLTEKAKTWVRELVAMLQHRPLHKLTIDELAELTGEEQEYDLCLFFYERRDLSGGGTANP